MHLCLTEKGPSTRTPHGLPGLRQGHHHPFPYHAHHSVSVLLGPLSLAADVVIYTSAIINNALINALLRTRQHPCSSISPQAALLEGKLLGSKSQLLMSLMNADACSL